MRPADMHLTPQELQSLLFGATDSTTIIADSATAQEAQQHLSGCAVCQSVAKKYTKADSLLRGLSSGNKGLRNLEVGDKLSGDQRRLEGPKRGRDCPADETWLNLAAGLISEEEAAHYVAHAAQCDWCGPLLKESMEDLAQPVTEEEQEALGKLPSASLGWQRAMAKKMAAASESADMPLVAAETEKPAKSGTPDKSKERAGYGWWPKLVWAGSGLAVVLVAVVVGVRLTREPDVNALLAQAYTEQRTIELRMPGAKYGPLQVERGNANKDLPAEFYTATGIIKTQLGKYPENPMWLQAQAQAHLLEWNYDQALQDLNDALAVKPNDPTLLLDKAIALFERAEKSGGLDYPGAAEYLGQVLSQDPNNAVALFNRAIVYEKLYMPDKAIIDLDHYLQIDPTGPWAKEAADRRERLKKQIKETNTSQAVLSPEEFNRRLTTDPATWNEMGPSIERYFTVAIGEWLPAAIVKRGSFQSLQARMALATLAEIARTRHQDVWFTELLSKLEQSESGSAITALAAAVQANGSGKFLLAREEAAKAQALFRERHNPEGEARAALEEIYALQLSDEAEKCLVKIQATRSVAAPYRWLSIHLQLEQVACLNMNGDIGRAEKVSKNAWQAAQEAQYPGLSLRALGFIAGIYREEGRLGEAWDTCRQGLEIYWLGSPYLMAGYNFYSFMDLMSEQTRQYHLNLAIDEQAVALLKFSGDMLLRGEEHRRLSQAAMEIGSLEVADANLLLAEKLLASAPQDEITENYRAQAEVEQARLQGRQNRTEEALAKLQSLSPRIARISNHSITSEYYQVIGELQASTGHFAEAEGAFSKAVDMAEQELSSLNSEAQRLTWARQSALPYYSIIELKLSQGDVAGGFEVLERYRGAGLRQRTKQPMPSSGRMADWISGRTSLATNSTLLVYALLPRGPMVWILDEHGLESRRLTADVLVMTQTARSFLELCAARSGQIARTDYLGRVLYHMLVAPVEDQIRPQRALIIESDPELKFPFQALTDSQGRYLLEKAPIVYIPAAAYFPELRHEQEISPDNSVVVGSNPAVEQYGLDSLPDVEPEAREVAVRLPHADLLLTKDATLGALRTRLGRATHFHFGGHAAQVKGTLGLVLGSSNSSAAVDVLDASEVSRIPMRKLRLATLAACSTENGSDRSAGDAESLARAFLRAGVPHVVASRWNVESAPTRELMRLFYDRLKSGMAPARALAAAELEFSKVPGREAPYFWAGFDAFGLN